MNYYGFSSCILLADGILETVLATLKQKKFANRGLVNGPYCVMYGFTAVLMTVGLQELTGFWLFLFAAVYATVVESDRRTSDGVDL